MRHIGLSFIGLIIVALLVAFLAMSSFNGSKSSKDSQQTVEQNAVDSAEDAVNKLNERMGQGFEDPAEEP